MFKPLSRAWLLENKYEVIQVSDNEYEVYHFSRRWGHKKLKPRVVEAVHKYGETKRYIYILNFPLAKLVYAWFIGDIPEGYEVDHIDDDPFNNRLENLQLLTRKENLQKRKKNGINQWYYIYNRTEEERLAINNMNKVKQQEFEERKKVKEVWRQFKAENEQKVRELNEEKKKCQKLAEIKFNDFLKLQPLLK